VYHYVAAQSSFITVQVADAHAHVQRLVSVVNMANVLEGCTTEEHDSFVRFLWAKGLDAKDICKELFPVYSRKCLLRKAVHKWMETFSLMTKSLKRR
jgi:hypothetical protein